jgi:hypothetical protein
MRPTWLPPPGLLALITTLAPFNSKSLYEIMAFGNQRNEILGYKKQKGTKHRRDHTRNGDPNPDRSQRNPAS